MTKKLHQQISYPYPSYKKFFSEVDGKTALAFWESYPSPHRMKDVSEEALAQFLRSHSNNGLSTKKANQILSLIAADGDTYRDFQDSRDSIVVSQVHTTGFLKTEIAGVEVEIEQLMGQLGFLLESMTGIDVVTAAELVSEIGDIHRFSNADKLARFAGIAPVTASSGNKSRNYKSKQGNRVLHDIFKGLAIRQIAVTRTKREPRNPYFHSYYEQKQSEGKTKQQAIICIMRKLVNIIYAMMKKKSAYSIPVAAIKQAG